ncbi:hypothetical protein LCGC14_1772150 [marine sediment metagenome]|uniref:Uncharacterized protein n=1 Tax=marine sediment metagenome TaxID=412755 RepID=A0A0F9GXY5_9ZZZZ
MITQGKLHNHKLTIHLETDEDITRNDGTHQKFAKMAEENTAYQSTLDLQISRAVELVKRWNCQTDLLEACKAHKACSDASSNCEKCDREEVCHGDMLPNFMSKAAIIKAEKT